MTGVQTCALPILVLAEGTVKNHVSTLLHKLQAPDRTALALTLYKAFQS